MLFKKNNSAKTKSHGLMDLLEYVDTCRTLSYKLLEACCCSLFFIIVDFEHLIQYKHLMDFIEVICHSDSCLVLRNRNITIGRKDFPFP